MKHGYVYIMTNRENGTLYTGVTSDLARRVYEHKNHIFKGFSKRHSLDKLVYYEIFDDIEEAIKREKCIKKWNRNWKLAKIDNMNPGWTDLYEDIVH
ncbi:MAG: GIY-YIG nuclease family protein [Rickettsiales bacterium]|nr:GIY-YIG nuclease family protein [Rickettsiales bacterium]